MQRIANDPTHRFFRKYGESMPEGDWNHPGTKQGIYMIGPDAEYLEGRFAAGGDREDMRKRLRRALQRWQKLRKRRDYRNAPVPVADRVMPPDIEGKALAFAVSLRDLASIDDPESVRRYRRDRFDDRNWAEFVKWAWNRNWIAFDDPQVFVTKSKEPRPVADEVVRRLYREVLVDNVRGQAPHWREQHVETATLTMRRTKVERSVWTIEYRGEAVMDAGPQGYRATLYGRSRWHSKTGDFESFELVAVGERRGAWRFNQRNRDPGPKPLGIALRRVETAAK